MVTRYCICGASLEITGEHAAGASKKLTDWDRDHWCMTGILGKVNAPPGHGRCSAVECWRARGGRPEWAEAKTGGKDG